MRAGINRRRIFEMRAHMEEEAQERTEADSEGQEAAPLDELEALDKIIRKIRDRLVSDEVKPSVADLIRLMDRRNEVVGVKPEPVEVRWIDEWQTPDDEE
jgi:hypothetical protein